MIYFEDNDFKLCSFRRVNLGGTHDKLLANNYNHVYLWKSGKRKFGLLDKSGKPRRATSRDKTWTFPRAEEFASNVAMRIMPMKSFIPVQYLPFPFVPANPDLPKMGTPGTIQNYLVDAQPYSLDSIGNFLILDKENNNQVVRNHILDWLISNLDTHSENTIICNGKLYFIDKAQSMRYMGTVLIPNNLIEDTLDRQLTPIGAKSVYATFFDLVKEEKITIDLSVVRNMIKRIECISDACWKRMLMPYLKEFYCRYLITMKVREGVKAKRLAKAQAKEDIKIILKRSLDRKNGIRKDIIDFYEKIFGIRIDFV